jgi:hypothetical protein
MSSTTVATKSINLPSGKVLVGSIYALCVLVPLAIFAAAIAFTDVDPYKSEGPVESMIGISIFGTGALVIAVLLSLWMLRSPERAKVGAISLGALSVLSLPFFWAGLPGIFGTSAAWVAGLTKDGRPVGGAGRIAGLAGVFIALLNVLVMVGGYLYAGLSD